MRPDIIAYYLPQYYPFKENNEWWGEGFTEWTNVGKAKPLYRNHYQPKVPADLGYYDLRMFETKKKQIELAREAGITVFCYWHYWFGNDRVLLDLPLKQVLESQDLNFPLCLGWANESWLAKVWNTEHKVVGKMLMEQLYPGESDIELHFNRIKKVLEDKRYYRIDNKPVFVIYKPQLLPAFSLFRNIWNRLLKESNIAESFYYIAYAIDDAEISLLLKQGYDAVNIVRTGEYRFNKTVISKIPLKLFLYKLLGKPLKLNYSFISKYFIRPTDVEKNVFPTLIPNWDHTPRSGNRGVVFHNSTPQLFKKHAIQALDIIKQKDVNRQILFLKSWNEWGEGNYMEPDLKYGKGYINALKEAIKEVYGEENHY